MKKIAALFIAVMMVLAMAACGTVKSSENASQTETSSVKESSTEPAQNDTEGSTETAQDDTEGSTEPTQEDTESSTQEDEKATETSEDPAPTHELTEEEKFKAQCEAIDYQELVDHIDEYNGRYCTFSGKINMVMGLGIFNMSVTQEEDGSWTDQVGVYYWNHYASYDLGQEWNDRKVTVWGTLTGSADFPILDLYYMSIDE